jgi:tRNA A-37 threonylcarbamoyl transferase component Bud32
MSFYYMDPVVKPQLLRYGDDLSFWLDSEAGTLVSKDTEGRELRRLEADDEVFFLKRSGTESLLRHLRMILFGFFPRCGALREVYLIQRLKSAGFAVMEPVAWGQERVKGFQFRGFLLVRKVCGKEVTDLFESSSGLERNQLMEQVGELMGKLHEKGFFQPVRLKDLICVEEGLVLIDRETSKPWKSFFGERRCMASLARAIRRTVRDGYRFGAGSAGAFLRGYQKGVAARWIVTQPRLRKSVMSAIREEMQQGGIPWFRNS